MRGKHKKAEPVNTFIFVLLEDFVLNENENEH